MSLEDIWNNKSIRLLIYCIIGVIISMTYYHVVKLLLPSRTSRCTLILGYSICLIGCFFGWIGFHIILLFSRKIEDSNVLKALLITVMVLYFILYVPFNAVLEQSQLQVPRHQKPYIATHIIALIASVIAIILLIAKFVGQGYNAFALGIGVLNGYLVIIGARLLWVALTSGSLDVVKEKKVVGRLVKKEDGQWAQVENDEADYGKAATTAFC